MIVDLFSGAGGFALGAVEAGLKVALAVDHDPVLTSSHRHNLTDIPLLLRDLGEVGLLDLLEEAKLAPDQITGVVGGPPCQGFSSIGKRDARDSRNALVPRFFGMVNELRPPFFVFENVPGIMTKRFRPLLDNSIDPLVNHYTVVGPLILNASAFGAATHRLRVIVLGIHHPSSPVSETDVAGTAQPTDVADALSGLPAPSQNGHKPHFGWQQLEPETDISTYALSMRRTPPDISGALVKDAHKQGRVSGFQATRHSSHVIERFSNIQPGDRDSVSKFPRLHLDRPAPTLRAGTGRDRGSYQSVRPIHPVEPRVITVREAARLQGFPDWFVFHRTKWHSFRMIGNSIVPTMAQRLLEACQSRIR